MPFALEWSLMKVKSLYRRLFAESPLPRIVVMQDGRGAFIVSDANKAALTYFGVARKALVGHALTEHLEAANRDHILQAMKVCMASLVPVSVQVIPILPGGIRVQSFVFNPLLGKDGNAAAIDIMARPPAVDQDAVARERDDALSLLTSVFDVSDVGIMVSDHHRRIVRVNGAFLKLFGWDAVDLIGQEFTVLIPEEDHDIARRRHDDFIGQDFSERSREIHVRHKDGHVLTMLMSSSIIELSAKRRFRMSTVVDITHLKTVEKDLRRAKELADTANQAKSAFLANMSHELRTPLNAIIGFSDMMLTQTLGPVSNPHYLEYLGDIKFSATHLLAIINDVLDMSKIEAGKMKLDEQNVMVPALLQDVQRLMTAKAMEGRIELVLEHEPGMPYLLADERMARQILLNLVSNAVKFSPANSKVVIRGGVEKGAITLSVTDNGIGIPADKIREVMEPFGQIGDPRISQGQGTGLGLPLAKAMMELHGGSLAINSKSAKGTEVLCRFPRSRSVQ